eukprot:Colp12_sorted_trinity150504_noHs@29803
MYILLAQLLLKLTDGNILSSQLLLKLLNTRLKLVEGLAELLLVLGVLCHILRGLLDGRGHELRLTRRHKAVLKVNSLGGTNLAGQKLLRGERGDVANSGREKIVLEHVRLAGHNERNRLNQASGVKLVEALDLALVDLATTLGKLTKATLGSSRLVFGQIVDIGGLVDNLEVADVAVTLAGKVDHVKVTVVEDHHVTGRGVDDLHLNGLVEVVGVPESKLTLRHLGETSGEEAVVLQEHNTGGLAAVMSIALGKELARVRLENTNLLVLGDGSKLVALVVEGQGVNGVEVTFNSTDTLGGCDVPQLDGKVERSGSKNVVGSGVPNNVTNLALVTHKVNNGNSEVLSKTAGRNLPDFHSAVLRTRGNNVLVEGVPCNIDNGALVAGDLGLARVNLAEFVKRKDKEGTTTGSLKDDCDERAVHSAVVRVPGTACKTDIVVGLLLLVGLTEHMPELGCTHKPRHFLRLQILGKTHEIVCPHVLCVDTTASHV